MMVSENLRKNKKNKSPDNYFKLSTDKNPSNECNTKVPLVAIVNIIVNTFAASEPIPICNEVRSELPKPTSDSNEFNIDDGKPNKFKMWWMKILTKV